MSQNQDAGQDSGRTFGKVAAAGEITDKAMRQVEVGGKKLLLFRLDGEVRCLGASCTHYGCSLASGVLSGGRIVCPCHHSVFDARTGQAVTPPALRSLPVYDVRTEGDDVLVAMEGGVPAPRPRPVPIVAPSPAGQVYAIVGAGAAGVAAAQAFRSVNQIDRLLLIGRERDLPYDRPPLTKEFLQGQKPEPKLALLADGAYADLGIELRLDREVAQVDAKAKTITLADGSVIECAGLVLATGAVPRPLDVPGADLAGVRTLRSLRDCKRIVDAVQGVSRAVVYGGSFIAMEAAASLHQRGLDVTVVYRGELPMAKVFGPDIARMLLDLHRENGVAFELGATIERIEGNAAGHAAVAVLSTGKKLDAPLLLAALGVTPATAMVKGLPLDRDGGIAVNDRMQAIPGVFAAGDVARFPEHVSGKRTRIEHWRVAGMTGRTAGLNLAGRDEPLDAVPFFWTGQFDTYVQYCGFAPEWEDIITHGDPAGREFLAFFVKAGRATAACCCGMAQETQLAAVSELMRQNRLPEPDVLRKTTDFTALL